MQQQNTPGGAPPPPVNPLHFYLTNPNAVPPIPLPVGHFWRWDNKRGRWIELVDEFPWGKFIGVVLLLIMFFPLGFIAGVTDRKIRPVVLWGLLGLVGFLVAMWLLSVILITLRGGR